jgi:hypothetical protein
MNHLERNEGFEKDKQAISQTIPFPLQKHFLQQQSEAPNLPFKTFW